MKRANTLYLNDILIEIRKIETSTQGLFFHEFADNYEKYYVVIRALEIIGEAANKLTNEFQLEHSYIGWSKIIGLRNVLIHEYFDLDLELVWNIVRYDLPLLKEQLQNIML